MHPEFDAVMTEVFEGDPASKILLSQGNKVGRCSDVQTYDDTIGMVLLRPVHCAHGEVERVRTLFVCQYSDAHDPKFSCERRVLQK